MVLRWQRANKIWGHTSEVGAVHQLHADVSFGEHADHPVLDEVHLLANGALSDDVVSGLEDFKPQLGQHGCHKVWIRIGKQRHGGHQLTAVEVHYFLNRRQEAARSGLYECYTL